MGNAKAQTFAAAGLGLVLVIIVVGSGILAWDEAGIPDLFQIVGGAAVGALATLATAGQRTPPP